MKKQKQKKRSAAIIEALEPRVLFSADLFGGAIDLAGTDDSTANLLDEAAAALDLTKTQVDESIDQSAGEIHEPAPAEDESGPVTPGETDFENIQSPQHELVVVDTATPDYQQLVDDILAHAGDERTIEVVLLDARQDGLDQLGVILSGYSGLDAVHLISHGDTGEIHIGNGTVDLATLQAQADRVATWGASLSNEADLLIYGCNLSSNAAGQLFVDSLAQLTGADVAASDDLTGHENLGGDWELEYQTGDVETAVAVDPEKQSTYEELLATNTAPSDLQTVETGNGGLSLNEDGGNDAYLIADDGGAILGGLSALTAEVRFSMDSFPNSTNFFSYATASDDNTFKFNIRDDGDLSVSINSVKINSGAMDYRTLADGQQHTLSVTWNSTGGAWEMFADGVSVDSGSGLESGVTLAGGGALIIGNDQDSVDGGYDPAAEVAATLYDARIFDDVRTGAEIAANFDQTLANTESGMIANWTFNDLSTSGVIIDTVSGNNLTVQNVGAGGGFVTSTPELTLKVQENATGGTVVGSVTGIDPDTGDTLTYTLQDDAGGRFDIDSGTGEITVANGSLLDYESSSSHNITVRVSDGSLTYDEALTIQVTDVNDPPIVDLNGSDDSGANFTTTFTEDGGQVNVTDVDAIITDVDNSTYQSLSVNLNSILDSTSERIVIAGYTFSYGAGETVVRTVGSTAFELDFDGSGFNVMKDGGGAMPSSDMHLLIRGITYENISQNPTSGDRVIQFIAQDSSGLTGLAATSTITVNPVNDAPVLDSNGHMTLTTITEDAINNSGDLVSAIIASAGGDRITDVDTGAVEGIAIFALTSGNGTWEYNVGSGWTPVGSVSGISSLLLRATDSLRFVPDGLNADTAFVTFAAWDQTSGAAGTKVDSSVYGGATAFSENLHTAAISVTAVNDAPEVVNLDGDTLNYAEGDGAVVMEQAGDVLVSDVDSSNFSGGSLVVEIDSGGQAAEDLLSIRNQGTDTGQIGVSGSDVTYGGTVIGTISGGTGITPLNVVFNSNAISVAVTALVQNITYENTNLTTPTAGARSVVIDITDGDGGASLTQNLTINVTAVNDAPIVDLNGTDGAGNNHTVTFTEGGGAINVTDVDAILTDADDTTFQSLSVNLKDISDGANELIVIAGYTFTNGTNEVVVRSVGSTNFEIDFYSSGCDIMRDGGGMMPLTDLQTLMQGITYENTSQSPTAGDRVFEFFAEDASGSVGSIATSTITVNPVNDAPTLANAIPDQAATEDTAFNFQFASNAFADVDVGDTLSYTAKLADDSALPSWLSFDANNRTFSGTPVNADVGTISIKVTADDGNGGTVTDTFDLTVNNSNDAPTVANAILDQNATEDTAFNFQFAANAFADVDVGDTLSYSASLADDSALPSWLSFDANNRTFSGTPVNTDVGTLSIKVTAEDGNGGTVSDTFTLTVNNSNDAPTVAIALPDQDATEDTAFNFQFASNAFADVDTGDSLSYTAKLADDSALPSWLSFDANSRTFSGTPANADVGTLSIKVTADDGNGGTVTDTFDLTVNNDNDVPTVANPIADQAATEDTAFNFQFASNAFTDVDAGDSLSYTAKLADNSVLPSWLSFDANNRTFSGTPVNADVGTMSIKVTADDGNGGTVSDTFTLTVNNSNDAPTVANAIADQAATEDTAFNFQFASNAFTDVDAGDSLSYTAKLADDSALPSWLSFDTNSRTFTGTPANADVGTISIKVTADDGNGGTVSDTFTLTVNNSNDAPTVANAILDQNATEDTAFNFQFAANAFADVDVGDTLSYSASLADDSALPSWLSFDANNRTFSGTPVNADVGTLSIKVTAEDGNGGTVSDTFTLTVNNSNDAPTVAIALPDQAATEDTAFNFQFASNAFTDVDAGDSLSYTAKLADDSPLPSWLSFDANNRTFSGTPVNADVGTISIKVTADDGNGGTVSDTFTLTVNNSNDAPTVANTIADQAATEDTAFNFQFASNAFTDVDAGDSLSYTAKLADDSALPSWLSFDTNSRTFTGTPANADVGTMSIKVTADDGNGGTVSDTFTLTVNNSNDAPTVANAILDQNATEDTAFNFQFAANAFADVDVGDTLSYSASLADDSALPSWLSFDANNRTFSGTPANADVGTISIKVTADDGNGGTVSDTFTLTVNNSNDAPTVANAIADQAATEDTAFNFQFASNAFTDVDAGDSLSYTAKLADDSPLPSWLSFDTNSRTFTGTPANADVGTLSIKVTADDGNGGTVTDTFDLTVNNDNDVPTVANPIADQAATEDTAFNFQFASNAFTDVDAGDSLSYTAKLADNSVLPSWLSFDANNRTFSGTPVNADVGTISIKVTADDGNGGTVSDTFTLTVNNSNDAPTVANAIADQAATEDTAFNFQFASNAFTDVDAGDSLSYTAKLADNSALPSWLSFDTNSRTFTGTPANADVGTISIKVTADDGNGGTVTDTFDLTVNNDNDVPTVANPIADQAATEDTAFNFQFASNAFADMDVGDTLSYTAKLADDSALPSWLSFDANSRTFSGTPANADVGTLSIKVTADDGNGGTVTDTFDLTVNNDNDVPTVANPIADQAATEDTAFNFQFASNAFTDVDAGDSLSYTAKLADDSPLPSWLSFDANSRTFSGTPANADVGTLSIKVTADDGNGGTVTDTFDLTVNNDNDVPTVANPIADQAATEDTAFNFQFASNAFTDVDAGDSLSYTAKLADDSPLPSWLSFDANNRTFSGTPVNADVGTISIKVTADDGNGGTVTDTFDLTVNNSNDAPTVANAILDQNATEDTAFNFQFAANAFADVDVGDTLSYSASLADDSALPSWLSFDANNRTFSGTPVNADVGTLSIKVTAEDGNGGTVSDTFTLTVNNSNDAPTVAIALPDQAATEDTAFNFQFASNAFTDVDAGDSLSYTAKLADDSVLPSWLSFDANSRTFSGTPANADVGTLNIKVTADDGNGGTVTDTFDLTVNNDNDVPTVANPIADQDATEDTAFNFQFASNAFTDVDAGDSLSYTAKLADDSVLPSWLSFDANNRTFSGTPANADVGTISIKVTADDGNGGTVSDTFTLTVNNSNDAPTVANAIADQAATEDTAFNFQFASNAFTDVDAGDSLSYTAKLADDSPLPSWLSFDTNSRTFTGTPANADVGTLSIKVTADDGNGGTVTDTFDLTVNNDNDVPTVANPIADQAATEDTAFNFQFASNAFTDVDAGDSLSYTAKLADNSVLPSWLSFDANNRTFSGTPVNADVGTISIKVTADDGNGGTVSDTFTLTVNNSNDAPTVANAIADQAATEDTAFNFQFASNAFTDVDAGDSLSYTAKLADDSALPSWLSFDTNSRTFTGTPANADVGTISIKVTADDGNGGTVSDTFTLTVNNSNDAPTVANAIADQAATEDTAFNFQFASNAFTDVDAGDSLSYTAKLADNSALPSWLSFDTNSRTFTGTPANADVGTISIKVTADDGNGGTVSDTFTLTVNNSNDAPTVANAILDQNATEDTAFNFQFAANAFADVDVGDTLSYSASLADDSALPSWLSFDANNRTFSGTPANADVGTISIKVTADDGNGGTVSDTFTLTVNNSNDAPTVANAIADQAATEDTAFNFQFASNAFTDVDAGDSLSYTAKLADDSPLPSWLSFDTNSRTFTGTPANADVGTLSIKVTADDGNGGTVTDTFDLTVNNDNDVPTVANPIADQAATEDTAFNFQFASNAFTDVDAGDSLSYTAKLADNSVLPSWLSFDANNRTFSGTPVNADVGTISIKVTADDGNGGTVSDTFTLTVNNSNDAPTVANAIADQAATEDTAFNFQFASNAFTDVDAGDSLSYTAKLADNSALPSWLSFDTNSRTFTGTPANADVGTISIKVTADDGNGGTVTDTFDLTVNNDNDVPTVANPIADQAATEDTAFNFQFASNAFADMDVGDTLSYTAKLADDSALPSWLSFDANSRTFSGTPANADVGTLSIKVTADDGNGGTVTDTFDLTVNNDNDVPTVANPIADQAATEDTAFNFQFASNAFADVDAGDSLSYSASLADNSALPSWLSFDTNSRTFSGTPANADVGTMSIKVTADDGNGGTVTDTFDLTVNNSNDAPTVANAILDQNATEDTAFNFQFAANAFADVDVGDTLSYSASLADDSALPSWLSFDANNRTFSGTPVNADVGTLSIKVTAEDGNGGTVSDTFTLTVNNSNDAPTVAIALPDQAATEDTAFNFQFASNAFADVDLGDSLSYTAKLADDSALPSWLSFDAASRTFSGTPANADVGTISIKVTADDGNGGTVSDTFTLTVNNSNDAPTVANAIADQAATEDTAFNFQFASNAFTDVDAGDSLSYTAKLADNSALPSWLSFDTNSRTFTGTPANADVGTISIKVTANDGNGGTVSDTFTLTVNNSNDAPTVANAIADQAATEDTAFNFQFASNAFTDVDAGDSLSYTAKLADDSVLPSWLSFDANSRTFSGTPANADVGTLNIKVTADDGNGGTVTDTFDLTVNNSNDAPTVANAIADQAATESLMAVANFKESLPTIAETNTPPQETDEGSDNDKKELKDGDQLTDADAEAADKSPVAEASAEEPPAAASSDPDESSAEGAEALPLAAMTGETLNLPPLDGAVLASVVADAPRDADANPYPGIAFKPLPPKSIDLRHLDIAPFELESQAPLPLQSPMDSAPFIEGLERMNRDLDQAIEESKTRYRLGMETLVGITMSLSAGFVSWVLKTGSLMASFMSTVPLWKQLDPLPILGAAMMKKHKHRTPQNSAEDETDAKVEGLFK